MVHIRPMQSREDRSAILQVDTAFTTNRIYDVKRDGLSFRLEEVEISPALHKDYGQVTDLEEYPFVVVAEGGTSICGFAAVKIETWNRRAVLDHLYVSKRYRGLGIGRLLIQSCIEYATNSHARCLWLETQNINYPAVHFYQRMGFEWCGLDTELYDEAEIIGHEIALYFVRRIE